MFPTTLAEQRGISIAIRYLPYGCTMSEKRNIFTNFRDKHGVADLLREVSQRKRSSLTPRDRKEVSDIASRVEQNAGKTIPYGTLQKNPSEDSGASTSTNDASINSNSTGSGPVNKWGKDFFQKFSNKQNANDQEQNGQRKDFFRNFSIKGIQIPLKAPQPEASKGENGQRSEFQKTIERSQQQGREMFQNLSKNFQKFSNDLKVSLPSQRSPTAAETAAEVSRTLCAAGGANASNSTPSPQDTPSPKTE